MKHDYLIVRVLLLAVTFATASCSTVDEDAVSTTTTTTEETVAPQVHATQQTTTTRTIQ